LIIKRNRRGMSLIEIMGAVCILSFSILAVATIFPTGLEINRKTRVRIQALEIASAIMEEIKNLPYTDVFNPGGMSVMKLEDWQSFETEEPKWKPRVIEENPELTSGESQIFFMTGGVNPQDEADLPHIGLDNLPPGRKVPTIVVSDFSDYEDTYGVTTDTCMKEIRVTVNIEERSKGALRYSFIQIVSYKSNALTSTPGM